MIKCDFGDYLKGESNCIDISNTTQNIALMSGEHSMMIIQTLTKHLVELGISKIYITTIRDAKHYEYSAKYLLLGHGGLDVTVVSPNIAIETDGPEDNHKYKDRHRFYYYYHTTKEDLSRAYCAHEIRNKSDVNSFHWLNSDTKLVNRGEHFINCSSALQIHTLGVITNDHLDRWGKHTPIISTFEMVSNITTIVFLIITAIVCGCWIHDCQNAAHLYIAFSVFYSATYALRLISYSAYTDISFCGNCGGLLLFFLLSSVLMLFCSGVALHVMIEDSYEVQYFVGKCVAFALGTPSVIILCLLIYDKITKEPHTTVFVTSDIHSDLIPIECWISAPIRYFVILLPILITLLTLIICLHRLRVIIEKDEDAHNDLTLALINGTIIIALLITITWTIGNLSIGNSDLTLRYMFIAFNAVQGIAIFYFVCINSTTVCSNLQEMCLKLKTRKNALLQDSLNEHVSAYSSLSSPQSARPQPVSHQPVTPLPASPQAMTPLPASPQSVTTQTAIPHQVITQTEIPQALQPYKSEQCRGSSSLSSPASDIDGTFNWLEGELIDDDMRQLIDNMEDIAHDMDNILIEDNLQAIEELISEAIKYNVITPEELSEEHVYCEAEYDRDDSEVEYDRCHSYEFLPYIAQRSALDILEMNSVESKESEADIVEMKSIERTQSELDILVMNSAKSKCSVRSKDSIDSMGSVRSKESIDSQCSVRSKGSIDSTDTDRSKGSIDSTDTDRSKESFSSTYTVRYNDKKDEEEEILEARQNETNGNEKLEVRPRSILTSVTDCINDTLPELMDPTFKPPPDATSKPPLDSIFRPSPDIISRPPPDSIFRPPPEIMSRPPPDIISRPPPDIISRPSSSTSLRPRTSNRGRSFEQATTDRANRDGRAVFKESEYVYYGDHSDSDISSISSTQSILRTVALDNPDISFIVPESYESDNNFDTEL